MIFLSVDTLRADHLKCYGYEKETSPAIDIIAGEGVLFENAFSHRGLTQPSLASIMTSKYINQHKLLDHIYSNSLSAENVTLAEYLEKNSYYTRAFSANILVNPEIGIHQGFKEVSIEEDEKKMTDMILAWLKEFSTRNPKGKFFLWAHYFDPHSPYTARKPYFEKLEESYNGAYGEEISFDEIDNIFLEKRNLSSEDIQHMIALYDSQISRVDGFLSEVIKELKNLGIYDQALLVFFSDHGEELYERNFYVEHYRSVYDSVLKIPLIMKYPGKIPEGKKLKNVVEAIDIMPTVLELCKILPEEKLSGKSLVSLINEKGFKKDFAVSEWWNLIFTLRTEDWAYIWNPTGVWPTDSRFEGGEYPVEKEELYDIKDDPYQKNNIVKSNREKANLFNEKMLNWMNSNLRKEQWPKSQKPEEKPKITKKQEDALRSLGYIR